ncbi:MAG: WD-repeat protein [Schlesneria sp.]|nr:WD-repeat protein [Schlesneria sp.]
MKYESIVRARGGTAEREIKIGDLVVPDVRSSTAIMYNADRNEIYRLYDDVTTLLNAIRSGTKMPDKIFVPDLWHTAIKMPPYEQEVVLDLWALGHDLVGETEYELDYSPGRATNGFGSLYVRTPNSVKHVVFLSHQSNDKPIVRYAAKFLQQKMTVIWDEWSFRRGKPLTAEIETGIEKSTALVLFWSENAAASKYVQFEDELAIARNIKDDQFSIQIVRLDETSLPKRYDRLIYHDWRRGRPGSKLFDSHLLRLSLSIYGVAPGEAD